MGRLSKMGAWKSPNHSDNSNCVITYNTSCLVAPFVTDNVRMRLERHMALVDVI